MGTRTKREYGQFGLTERAELDWKEYLQDFVTDVFPIFKAHGVTLGEALILWKINGIYNNTSELLDKLGDE